MGFTASIKFGCHGHFTVLRALLGSYELSFLVKELAFIGEANHIVSKVGKVTNLLSRVVQTPECGRFFQPQTQSQPQPQNDRDTVTARSRENHSYFNRNKTATKTGTKTTT